MPPVGVAPVAALAGIYRIKTLCGCAEARPYWQKWSTRPLAVTPSQMDEVGTGGPYMTFSLQEELGVAPSGLRWVTDDFLFWESSAPEVVLFVPRRPLLAFTPEHKRYQAALTLFRQRQGGNDTLVGGTALLTVTTTVAYTPQLLEQLAMQWDMLMQAAGNTGRPVPKFVPLPRRNSAYQFVMDPALGQVSPGSARVDPVAAAETTSLMIDLTAEGAQRWQQAITARRTLPAGIRVTYEYPRQLPGVRAQIRATGSAMFAKLFTSLKVRPDGRLYGSATAIAAAWSEMVRAGVITITLLQPLPEEVAALRQQLIDAFAEQTLQQSFATMFQPEPAAVSAGNAAADLVYLLRWKQWTEATDLRLDMRFDGWNWLTASMDTDLGRLLALLDSSYVNEVYQERSFPVSITVHGDPVLESLALSWSASEGKAPEALVFGAAGGSSEYVLSSVDPDNVVISYTAKTNFTPPRWPIIETSGKATVAKGGNRIVLQPGTWIGRLKLYFYIREGDVLKPLTDLREEDYLVVNVSYHGPHLRNPIKDSARLTPQTGIEFMVPLDPAGRPTQAMFSAFGLISGQMMRTNPQPIHFDEGPVYILASSTGIQLVSKASGIPESDQLAQRLLTSQARPMLEQPM